MLKIRRSRFDMGIPIPRKGGLYTETGNWFIFNLWLMAHNLLVLVHNSSHQLICEGIEYVPYTSSKTMHTKLLQFMTCLLYNFSSGFIHIIYLSGSVASLNYPGYLVHKVGQYQSKTCSKLFGSTDPDIVDHGSKNDINQTIYIDAIMSAMAFQITIVSIVCSTFCSSADQRKHKGTASLAFVSGIHRWPVDSPHKGSVMRKITPLMTSSCYNDSTWLIGLSLQCDVLVGSMREWIMVLNC